MVGRGRGIWRCAGYVFSLHSPRESREFFPSTYSSQVLFLSFPLAAVSSLGPILRLV